MNSSDAHPDRKAGFPIFWILSITVVLVGVLLFLIGQPRALVRTSLTLSHKHRGIGEKIKTFQLGKTDTSETEKRLGSPDSRIRGEGLEIWTYIEETREEQSDRFLGLIETGSGSSVRRTSRELTFQDGILVCTPELGGYGNRRVSAAKSRLTKEYQGFPIPSTQADLHETLTRIQAGATKSADVDRLLGSALKIYRNGPREVRQYEFASRISSHRTGPLSSEASATSSSLFFHILLKDDIAVDSPLSTSDDDVLVGEFDEFRKWPESVSGEK